MTTWGIHCRTTPNLGDKMCRPGLWFPLNDTPLAAKHVPERKPEWTSDDVAIVGGGGHLMGRINNWIQILFEEQRERKIRCLVSWGLGTNLYDMFTRNQWPAWLEFADLCGLRDYGATMPKYTRWVPCVSCMAPEFDNPPEPTRDVVFYVHARRRVSIAGAAPLMNNYTQDFKEVIAFLSSGRTVVTNSYHGMFWATILNRKVIVPEPWATKFLYAKHPPFICTGRNWREGIKHTPSYPEALEECREANRAFYDLVADRLNA